YIIVVFGWQSSTLTSSRNLSDSTVQIQKVSVNTMSASALPIQSTHAAPTPQQVDEARTAFTASLLSAGTSTVQSDLQARAGDLHANAAAIDKQEQELLKETKNLGKESAKWQKLADDGARGVKETGDVQNWAEMLERDLCVLEDTMAMAEEGDATTSAPNGRQKLWQRINLNFEINLLPPYGHGNLIATCTNLAPGTCCIAPRGTGADDVHIQHLTMFDIAALFQSRRERSPSGPLILHDECSGRVVDSRPGPGAWRWHRRREGAEFDSPGIHGASYVTLPRTLPPDGKAKVWMAVEGLLGLAWGDGDWFVNERVKSALMGSGGGFSGFKAKREIRSEKKGRVHSGRPRRRVHPDVLEFWGTRYTEDDGGQGVMYSDGAGNSLNMTKLFGMEG
ncbi:MAG: hypothetical protein Q9180_005759, partial [Flavoplaca navasiana]